MGKRKEIMVLAVLAMVAPGCQEQEQLGRVYGRVTFQGEPITEGILVFSNAQQGIHMTADLAPDGTYELQNAGGFGLPLGTYQVAVNPPIPEPPVMGAPSPPPKPKSFTDIPPKFRELDTSGLSITVVEGENRFDIDMPSAR